jgi:hypothetical protein
MRAQSDSQAQQASPNRNVVQRFLCSRELEAARSPARHKTEVQVRDTLVERLPVSLREQELPVARYEFDKVLLHP